MVRKRRSKQGARTRGRFQSKKSRKFATSFTREEKAIIETLFKANLPLSVKNIAQATPLIAPEACRDILSSLTHKQIVTKLRNQKFALQKRLPLVKGVLDHNPQGFGFIHSIEPGNTPPPTKDPYVSKYDIGDAQHGDSVLIFITHTAKNGRCEAVIISVLKRNKSQIAGIISISESGECLVLPEDQRFPFAIQVKLPKKLKVSHGDGVLVTLEASATPDKLRHGKIVEVLGDPDSVACQIRFVTEKHNLPHIFHNNTLGELKDLHEDTEQQLANRVDLRDIPHITIDGETAKDFDDAVTVLAQDNGFRLYVSIADVSHYVEVGSSLDRDAYERGTSVYFPGTVIPMLPEKLSNNLCSLVPNEDRLTVTAILDFDKTGKLLKKSFCRSIINSKCRFTYNKVWDLLQTGECSDQHELSFLPMLKDAQALALALKKRRSKRGALGFTIPETVILLDNTREIEALTRTTTNFAHKIIEEFMLSANEAVAEFFTEQQVEALYRVHETPDEDKIKEFNTYTHNLGLKLPKPDGTPKWFGEVITASQGSTNEYVINNLLLRSMKQAKYTVDNIGHFGLAATNYTHFTSPIRRYPDLMVHRELCKLIDAESRTKKNRSSANSGAFLSGRERAAVKACRELDDRLKCIYMEKHIGETFDAVISGVTDSALYFELVEMPVSCMASLSDLADDIYLFEHRSHTLIAQNHGIHYHLGETMSVTISRIDRVRNKIIVHPLAKNESPR